MATLKRRLKNAYHNVVLHPIAGLCWLFGFQAWGDRVHGTEKPRWWIITFEGGEPRFLWADELEPRPAAARPDNGDPFTPWYENRQHTHDLGNGFLGCHVYAENPEEAYRQAFLLVSLELAKKAAATADTTVLVDAATVGDDEGYW